MNRLKGKAKKTIRRFANLFSRDQKWRVCEQEMVLPKYHRLPLYQIDFPFYDRFLPLLARRINSGVFVDIGANVGDSGIAMLEGTSARLIVIEGDDSYVPYLKMNLERYTGRWELIHSFLGSSSADCGKDAGSHRLASEGGNTKVEQDSKSRYPSLHKALTEIGSGGAPVRLIKSDTEGFDYLLLSDYLRQSSFTPTIFFENLVLGSDQMEQANEFAHLLHEKGYCVVIFDNLGQPLCGPCSPESLIGFNSMLLSFKDNANGPFAYIDVLAYTSSDEVYAISALKDYLATCYPAGGKGA